MATSTSQPGSATKEWQKNQENEQLKKKVNLIAAQTANQQKNAQLNQGNPSALPSTTAVNVNGQQSLPSIPTNKPADPKAEMAKATAKAINTNPANNLEEPVNAATEKSANDAKIEGEEDNPVIPRPSQNDDVTKAQLGVNANEAAKGEKPTNVVNAPVGDDVFDSFSYEDRPSIKGRWNWNLEHSFMLPKSAWADEVRKNAQVENQMRAQDSAQWQMRRNQQNDLLNKKMAAQKANQPKSAVPSSAAVRSDNNVMGLIKQLNTDFKNGVYGNLEDAETKDRYMNQFNAIEDAYIQQCEEFGRKPNMGLLYNLYGSNTAEGQAIESAQQNNDATAAETIDANLQNVKSYSDAQKVLESAEKAATAQAAVKTIGTPDLAAKGVVSLAGNKFKTRGDYQKAASKVELATTDANLITSWLYDENGKLDQKRWEEYRPMFDAMGDKLAGEVSGDSGSGTADAAKVRAAYMAVHPVEHDLLVKEMVAYEKEMTRIMRAAGMIDKSLTSKVNTKLIHEGVQNVIDGTDKKKNKDGTKITEGINQFREGVKSLGTFITLKSGNNSAFQALDVQLQSAVEAHEKFEEAILKSGSQNPKYLYRLADELYKVNKDKINAYDRSTQSNPYKFRPFNIPSDEQLDAIDKQWIPNEMIVLARPSYVPPEEWVVTDGAEVDTGNGNGNGNGGNLYGTKGHKRPKTKK